MRTNFQSYNSISHLPNTRPLTVDSFSHQKTQSPSLYSKQKGLGDITAESITRKPTLKTKSKPLSETGINTKLSSAHKTYNSTYTSPAGKSTTLVRSDKKKSSLNMSDIKKGYYSANNSKKTVDSLTSFPETNGTREDENLTINKIPLSPIGLKRAGDPIGRFARDTSDMRVYTDISRFDLPNTNSIMSGVATEVFDSRMSMQGNSLFSSDNRNENNYSGTANRSVQKTPDNQYSSEVKKSPISNLKENYNGTSRSHTMNSGFKSPKNFPPSLQKDKFPNRNTEALIPNRNSLHSVSQQASESNERLTITTKSLSVPISSTEDSSKILYTENIEVPPRNTEIVNSNHHPLVLQKSKASLENKGSESRSTFNLGKFTTKFDFIHPKTLIQNIINFATRKRLKCSCDSNLSEDQTCSRAYKWISRKYKESEHEYLKSTYEKILSESKLIDQEHVKQIKKDINRTYPDNKFYAEDSPGVKTLERILNVFAKYDPQIAKDMYRALILLPHHCYTMQRNI